MIFNTKEDFSFLVFCFVTNNLENIALLNFKVKYFTKQYNFMKYKNLSLFINTDDFL